MRGSPSRTKGTAGGASCPYLRIGAEGRIDRIHGRDAAGSHRCRGTSPRSSGRMDAKTSSRFSPTFAVIPEPSTAGQRPVHRAGSVRKCFSTNARCRGRCRSRLASGGLNRARAYARRAPLRGPARSSDASSLQYAFGITTIIGLADPAAIIVMIDWRSHRRPRILVAALPCRRYSTGRRRGPSYRAGCRRTCGAASSSASRATHSRHAACGTWRAGTRRGIAGTSSCS